MGQALITGRAAALEPPSRQIFVGVIGSGGQGTSDARALIQQADCRVVAACDADELHLNHLVWVINDHYKNKDCKPYHDFRDLLGRSDIDAVLIALPDHWHGAAAVAAARRKKDIYGEKPLARTIAEQQAIVRAVQENNRIWQTGSWQRSVPTFHKAAEIVRNGLIGKVTRVEVGLPHGNGNGQFRGAHGKFLEVSTPPSTLDYNFWVGPSSMMPYIEGRLHKNWRWNYNFGGGQLMDWVGHHCDIAHWGLGFDNSGPSEIEGHGEFPPYYAVWNTATRYRIELKYPDDITMIIAGGHDDIRSGCKWIGAEGWVWVDRGGFEASNQDWRDIKQLPESQRKIQLTRSDNHFRNWLDAIKSRQPAITPAETAHHSAIPGHLGLISMLTGRKLRWDAPTEKILDDPEASELLTRPFRQPWTLD